tara:strand:+ start:358 stop:1719 length:1362 start_codon:yes stop_codon:yes gene_type:complete
MPTVSPNYQQRGTFNPYYLMKQPIIASTHAALKKQLPDEKFAQNEIFFKCVDMISGKEIYKTSASARFRFQLAIGKKENIVPYGIRAAQTSAAGHLGMTSRKSATQSSNVNEFLSVYFLAQPDMDPAQLQSYACGQSSKSSTGVMYGDGRPVTFGDLVELLDADATPERDINIGRNNAKAIRKDIKGKGMGGLYWTPKQKPGNVSPKNPSDVVVTLGNGTFQGYSNKIASGTDATPKFNTNIFSYYGKLGDSGQLNSIKSIIDRSWDAASSTVKGENARAALSNFNIRAEPYSESGSRDSFADLARSFIKDGLDFYGKDFYYPYRNNLITGFKNHLTNQSNLTYFLKTIYFYTYDDPNQAYTPCPYKLLVGQINGSSNITNVSDNTMLKSMLLANPSELSKVTGYYDGTSQSFKISFKYKLKTVNIPVTCRTRAAGGWSGKSLYITSSGVKFL